MPSSVLKGQSDAPPLFKPPSGGDLTLRSSDGVDFLVHSTILKLASSVFGDMIATGTTKDTVELSENAADISYLLRFIYPNRFPVAINLDELPNRLQLTQKYDVEGAAEIIDELIAMDGSPYKPLTTDPIRTYQLAVQFNLTKTKLAAAPLICSGRTNFCDLNKLPELARTYPSLKLICMMNLQGMRSKVLFDVLFDFQNKPMLPDGNFYYDLSCAQCWNSDSQYGAATDVYKKFPTTWSLAWARLAYETLLVSQIDQSQFLFQVAVIQRLHNNGHVCQLCLPRIESSYSKRFENWASGVRRHLEMQLEKLELLYTL